MVGELFSTGRSIRAWMILAIWCQGSLSSEALLAPQAVSEQIGSRWPPSPLRLYFPLNSSSEIPSRSPLSSYGWSTGGGPLITELPADGFFFRGANLLAKP